MKRLFLILIIIFTTQSLIKADDIRDFEIEGMSLYQSALNFFSETKIKNSEEDYYQNKTFKTATIDSSNFEVYQDVQISYKAGDKKYILYDISGIVVKKYDICLDEIKSISKEFDKMFSKTKFEDLYTYKYDDDPSGKSLVSDMYWEFDNGDKILLACYKWNPEYEKGYADDMRITISSKEFDQFLLNE
jgi:hypothetical protein